MLGKLNRFRNLVGRMAARANVSPALPEIDSRAIADGIVWRATR